MVVVGVGTVVVAGTVEGGSWVGGTDCVEGGSCVAVLLPRLGCGVVCPRRSPRAGTVVGGTVDGVNGGAAGTVVVGGAGTTVLGAVTVGGVTVTGGFACSGKR